MSHGLSTLHALAEHVGLARTSAQLATTRGEAAPRFSPTRPLDALVQVGRASGRDPKLLAVLGGLMRHPLDPDLLGLLRDEFLLARRHHEARVVDMDVQAEALVPSASPAPAFKPLGADFEVAPGMLEPAPGEFPDLVLAHLEAHFVDLDEKHLKARRAEAQSGGDDPAVRAELALAVAWQGDDAAAREAVADLLAAVRHGSVDPAMYVTLVSRLHAALDAESLEQVREVGTKVLHDIGLACWSARLCRMAELFLGVAGWLGPSDVPARFHLSELLTAEGHFERARVVLESHPPDGVLETPFAHWLEVGRHLLAVLQEDPAATATDEAIARNRALAVPHAWALLRAGDAGAAHTLVGRASDLLPGWAMARRVDALARILTERGSPVSFEAFDDAASKAFDLDLYRYAVTLYRAHPDLPRAPLIERIVTALARTPYVRGLWQALSDVVEDESLAAALRDDLEGRRPASL